MDCLPRLPWATNNSIKTELRALSVAARHQQTRYNSAVAIDKSVLPCEVSYIKVEAHPSAEALNYITSYLGSISEAPLERAFDLLRDKATDPQLQT